MDRVLGVGRPWHRLVTPPSGLLRKAGRLTSHTRASPPTGCPRKQGGSRAACKARPSFLPLRRGERTSCRQEVPSGAPAEALRPGVLQSALGFYPQFPSLSEKEQKGSIGSPWVQSAPPPPTNPGKDYSDSRLLEASGLPAPPPVPPDSPHPS